VGRRILAIAAATVIALIGAVLVLIYARGADARAVEAASPQTVYVSSATVPAGTSLKEAVRLELITQTKTAASAVPAGALTSVNDANSALLALKDIPPGQYILEASFGETPVGEKAIQVPAGKLAVSVQLSDPARVGNFVTPGSFLTIFATHPEATAPAASGGDEDGDAAAVVPETTKATSVLLDNLQVIAMGDAVLTQTQTVTPEDGEEEPTAGLPSFLVTLAVTPEQATRLVHGVNSYQLYAGLRGAEVKVNPKLTTNDSTIFGAR
jgi:pilus assembly protein CpaB